MHPSTRVLLVTALCSTAFAAHAATFVPPAFVIGVWSQPASTLAKWKARGVNTGFGYEAQGGSVSNATWSQAAADAGLAYIRHPGASLAADAADPRLLAWLHEDEPEIHNVAPSVLAADYAIWKAAAPNKPVAVTFSGGNVVFSVTPESTYRSYIASADWIASDFYPISGWKRADWLYRVGETLDTLSRWSGNKPQYAFIETSSQPLPDGPPGINGVSPGQFRSMAWSAVIHGARGIIYFPDAFNPEFVYDSTPPEIVAEMTQLNSRLTDISATLAGPINPAALAATVDAPLEAGWRKTVTGRLLIVLNPTNRTLSNVAIRLGGSGAATAKVQWEARTVQATGGTITDSFEPFGVHVYQVTGR